MKWIRPWISIVLLGPIGCSSLPILEPLDFANPGIQQKLTQLAWPDPLRDVTYFERAVVEYDGARLNYDFVVEVEGRLLSFRVLSDLGDTESSASFTAGVVTIDRSCHSLPNEVFESLVWDHALILLGPVGVDPRLVAISREVPNGWALEYTLSPGKTVLYQKQRGDGGLDGGPNDRGSGRAHRLSGNEVDGVVIVTRGGFRSVRSIEIENHRHGYKASVSLVGRQ